MDTKGRSEAVTKVDDTCSRTSGWLRWLTWLDEVLPGLKDAPPSPRRCFQGTVVSLQGRFPNGSGCFRFERIGMIDERTTTLVNLPVDEAAQIPSSLCLGIQVRATVRDGSVVVVKMRMSTAHKRRQRTRRHDLAVG